MGAGKERYSPFISSALIAKDLNLQFLEGPAYFRHRMTLDEANNLPWDAFKSRIQPFSILKDQGSKTEFALSPKSPPWTYKDFTVFAGSTDKKIATIKDLNDEEGATFLDINSKLARTVLSNPTHDEVHVSIGFNESDYIPDQHHSIKTRLHSHVYVADSALIRESLVPQKWQELNWVDRLRFMEPTIPIVRDLLESAIEAKLFSDYLKSKIVSLNSGYISVDFRNNINLANIFPELKYFFLRALREYGQIEYILTERVLDSETDRYLPRAKAQRIAMMEVYIASNKDWLSSESIATLRYLAKSIVKAEGRNTPDRSINNARQTWATKGFAGAINFSLRKDRDSIRMDLVPCIFSTSSMNKVLVAQEFPTLLRRAKMEATDEQKKVMNTFYGEVVSQLDDLFPDYERVI